MLTTTAHDQAIVRALTSSADEGEIGLAELLGAVRTHLGMEVAFVAEFVAGRRVFRHVDSGSPDVALRPGDADPLEESYCQRVVDGRLPELILDARDHAAAAELPVTFDLPVGAHLSVPVRLADGRVYGTFCCFSRQPDLTLTERDLCTMRVFAEIASRQIDRQLAASRHRRAVDNRIRRVLDGHGLSMVYQPIVDIDRRAPVGFEALARFSCDPQRPPNEWFTEAASVGMAPQLECCAIRQALAILPSLPAGTYLSVNASPEAITSELTATLAGAPLDRLVVEMTEHDAVATYDRVKEVVGSLRRQGLRLAIDDVGAGYATFRHILRLNPDIIKIDSELTRDVDRDPVRRAFTSAVIRFAHETKTAVVVEGVETDGELQTLRRLGATTAQGYLLGRPGPVGPPKRRRGRGEPARTQHAEAIRTAD